MNNSYCSMNNVKHFVKGAECFRKKHILFRPQSGVYPKGHDIFMTS